MFHFQIACNYFNYSISQLHFKYIHLQLEVTTFPHSNRSPLYCESFLVITPQSSLFDHGKVYWVLWMRYINQVHIQHTFCMTINSSSYNHTFIAVTMLLAFTLVYSSICYLHYQFLMLESRSFLRYTSVQPISMISIYCQYYIILLISRSLAYLSPTCLVYSKYWKKLLHGIILQCWSKFSTSRSCLVRIPV